MQDMSTPVRRSRPCTPSRSSLLFLGAMTATSLGSSCTADEADEGVPGYVDGPLDGFGGSSSAGGSGGAGGSSGSAAITQGERYTPDPVAFGQIPGLSYSFADAAGVSDGEGPGRVWFHD